MAVVERFSRGMIERYLRGYELPYTRDDDGSLIVRFDYDEEIGGKLVVMFAATGDQREIYTINVGCNRLVARSDWGKVIAHCNEWNTDRRWPRARLYIDHPSTDTKGYVFLDLHLDLAPGIHWDLFEHTTSLMILAGHEFWKWAYTRKGM